MKTSNSVVEISARPRGLEQESASLNAVSLCINKNNFKLSLCKEIKQRSEEQLRRRGKLEAIFCTIWKKGLVLEQRLWSWRFSGLTCSFQQDHGKPQPARTAAAQLHCKCSRDKARSLGFSLAQSIWCIMKFKNHKKPKLFLSSYMLTVVFKDKVTLHPVTTSLKCV